MKTISDTKNSQGIIAEVNIEKYKSNALKDIDGSVIVLNKISDPGNLGTIFRTSAWYGIQSIILTSNSIDPFNLKCLRSGVGAHFYFKNIIVADNKEIIKHLENENYEIYCADLQGKDITKISAKEKWALILGSEAHGFDGEFKQFNKITITKASGTESLNVAVACGIILNQLLNK